MEKQNKVLISQSSRCNLCGLIYWESALFKNKYIGYLCQECTEHWERACNGLRKKIIKSKRQKAKKEEIWRY